MNANTLTSLVTMAIHALLIPAIPPRRTLVCTKPLLREFVEKAVRTIRSAMTITGALQSCASTVFVWSRPWIATMVSIALMIIVLGIR